MSSKTPEADATVSTVTTAALLLDDHGTTFRQFLHDFFFVARQFEQGRASFAKAAGLTSAQYHMLMAIARSGSGMMSPARVAEDLHLHQSFVILHLGKMVERSLLKRKPNPRDKRSVLFGITGKGWTVIHRILPLVQVSNDTMFGVLTEPEIRMMAHLFGKLSRNCELASKTLEAAQIRFEQENPIDTDAA